MTSYCLWMLSESSSYLLELNILTGNDCDKFCNSIFSILGLIETSHKTAFLLPDTKNASDKSTLL